MDTQEEIRKLEHDIGQKEFDNEAQKALINLLYTNNFVVNKLNDFFKKHQLTRQQYNVLRILRGQYPKESSISIIKERMIDKMSDASRIADRLVLKGLIEKKVNAKDRRSTHVLISNKGLQLLNEIGKEVSDLDYLMKHLNHNELTTLNDLLNKLRTQD